MHKQFDIVEACRQKRKKNMRTVQRRNRHQVEYAPGEIIDDDDAKKNQKGFGQGNESDGQTENNSHQKIHTRPGHRNFQRSPFLVPEIKRVDRHWLGPAENRSLAGRKQK